MWQEQLSNVKAKLFIPPQFVKIPLDFTITSRPIDRINEILLGIPEWNPVLQESPAAWHLLDTTDLNMIHISQVESAFWPADYRHTGRQYMVLERAVIYTFDEMPEKGERAVKAIEQTIQACGLQEHYLKTLTVYSNEGRPWEQDEKLYFSIFIPHFPYPWKFSVNYYGAIVPTIEKVLSDLLQTHTIDPPNEPRLLYNWVLMRLKDGAITHHSQANYPGVIGSHYRWQPEQYLLLFTTSSFATRQHNRVLAEVQERGIFGWQRFWSLAGYAPSLEIVENPQEPIPQAQFETHVQPEKTWIYTIAGTCLLASILIMLLSNALKPSKNKKKISEAAGASDMPSVNYKAGQPHIERGEVAASGKGEPGARLGSEADIPARTTECRVRLGVPLGEGRTREVPAIEREAVAEWVMGTMDSRPSSRAGSEAESTVHSSSVYTPSPSTVGARSPASSFTG